MDGACWTVRPLSILHFQTFTLSGTSMAKTAPDQWFPSRELCSSKLMDIRGWFHSQASVQHEEGVPSILPERQEGERIPEKKGRREKRKEIVQMLGFWKILEDDHAYRWSWELVHSKRFCPGAWIITVSSSMEDLMALAWLFLLSAAFPFKPYMRCWCLEWRRSLNTVGKGDTHLHPLMPTDCHPSPMHGKASQHPSPQCILQWRLHCHQTPSITSSVSCSFRLNCLQGSQPSGT